MKSTYFETNTNHLDNVEQIRNVNMQFVFSILVYNFTIWSTCILQFISLFFVSYKKNHINQQHYRQTKLCR